MINQQGLHVQLDYGTDSIKIEQPNPRSCSGLESHKVTIAHRQARLPSAKQGGSVASFIIPSYSTAQVSKMHH